MSYQHYFKCSVCGSTAYSDGSNHQVLLCGCTKISSPTKENLFDARPVPVTYKKWQRISVTCFYFLHH